MTRRIGICFVIPLTLVAFGCAPRAANVTEGTLAELRDLSSEVEDTQIEQGLEQAMEGYRRFLEEAPETEMTPEAMRRLADLQIEREFGIAGDSQVQELTAPAPSETIRAAETDSVGPATVFASTETGESDEEFEERTTAEMTFVAGDAATPAAGSGVDSTGALEAIALYDRLLTEYPDYENNDQVLYQKARAYDELGRTDEAIETMEQLASTNPYSEHYDEVQFRRGEYFFTRSRYFDAEDAYQAITTQGRNSSYYELALYKLGWTFYKQELYEEALHEYMALLDYKVSIGYDFDDAHEQDDERRVADTHRAVSLSFSYLGGPDTVPDYFSTFGNRSYEDRVYSNLGEHYLTKLRYDDAAKTYKTFETLYPFHRSAPHFSMRIIEIFAQGGFPLLVLESKREFASRYGLESDYWRRFVPEESPEVLGYLKANLADLATHYHAEYQSVEEPDVKLAHYNEARRWYGDYLGSFPRDEASPAINYRLADLLLEHGEFGEAAREYERTAYDYPSHGQSADAGYAAVYAYREQLSVAPEAQREDVRGDVVASSLRFADTYPNHAQAAAVLGAAADDMYEMEDYPRAIESARRVIDSYPDTDAAIRRSAWVVVAHGSFELADYPNAEEAYTEVLTLTPETDESHASMVDNLAASIYSQGELESLAGDYRAAADHFLRIRTAAPSSTIRPAAEYDAGAALTELGAWTEAAEVFDEFRGAYPDHELHTEATRQIAYAYQQDGQLSLAAMEYERFASEAVDPALRSEALLVAGDLYSEASFQRRALNVYSMYVEEFPKPVEMNVETRFKMAEIHKAANDVSLYHGELAEIVRIDGEAGPERTGRTRTLASRSALVLAEQTYGEFTAVRLSQPFEASLQEKRRRMDETVGAMERLVAYEIADVTAAATYYMAETYFDFSQSLINSERPADLRPEELPAYEAGLDEAAFPFEERAIDVHEENIELLHAGVFNDWTEKSLGRLSELMPGRYAKEEISSGFIGSIDGSLYEVPTPLITPATTPGEPGLDGAPVLTTEPATAPVDDLEEEHASPL